MGGREKKDEERKSTLVKEGEDESAFAFSPSAPLIGQMFESRSFFFRLDSQTRSFSMHACIQIHKHTQIYKAYLRARWCQYTINSPISTDATPSLENTMSLRIELTTMALVQLNPLFIAVKRRRSVNKRMYTCDIYIYIYKGDILEKDGEKQMKA